MKVQRWSALRCTALAHIAEVRDTFDKRFHAAFLYKFWELFEFHSS